MNCYGNACRSSYATKKPILPPFLLLKPTAHLAILYADRGEFDRIFPPPINVDTFGDFFRRSRRCGSFEKLCDKIAQPVGLIFFTGYSQ